MNAKTNDITLCNLEEREQLTCSMPRLLHQKWTMTSPNDHQDRVKLLEGEGPCPSYCFKALDWSSEHQCSLEYSPTPAELAKSELTCNLALSHRSSHLKDTWLYYARNSNQTAKSSLIALVILNMASQSLFIYISSRATTFHANLRCPVSC